MPLLQERLRRLDDFIPMADFFLTSTLEWSADDLVQKGMDKKATYRGLGELATALDDVRPWTAAQIEAALRDFAAAHEAWSNRNLFMLVRLVVTGRRNSPPLFESMEAVGKSFCQDRFRRATQLLRS
jgi:glutamyl-tRNA synthetase